MPLARPVNNPPAIDFKEDQSCFKTSKMDDPANEAFIDSIAFTAEFLTLTIN